MISKKTIRNEEIDSIRYQFSDLLKKIPLTTNQRNELEGYFNDMAALAKTPLSSEE